MLSRFAIIGNLLLASATLAAPSAQLEPHLVRRTEYGINVAGAIQPAGDGAFHNVTGTFIVPALFQKNSPGAVSAWVGLDGFKCTTAVLKAGVSSEIDYFGYERHVGWIEWFPEPTLLLPELSVTAGEVIEVTVTAHSPTSGDVFIKNLTTGKKVFRGLTSTYPLCGDSAEWMVEAPEDGTSVADVIALAHFNKITITHATATSHCGEIYTPAGATIIDMKPGNGSTLAFATINGADVIVEHV